MLSICKGNKADSRNVYHFHFTGWPDHGVPATSQLLLFYFRVREKLDSEIDNSPLVVHCRYFIHIKSSTIFHQVLSMGALVKT